MKRHEPRDNIRSHQELRELVRNLHGLLILRNSFTKVEFTMKPRKWISIPACPELISKTFSADVSTYVLRLVRHYEQEERESDRAFHWNDLLPNLANASWHEILGQRLASRIQGTLYCILVQFKVIPVDTW